MVKNIKMVSARQLALEIQEVIYHQTLEDGQVIDQIIDITNKYIKLEDTIKIMEDKTPQYGC